MHYASREGRLEMVKLLLARGTRHLSLNQHSIFGLEAANFAAKAVRLLALRAHDMAAR